MDWPALRNETKRNFLNLYSEFDERCGQFWHREVSVVAGESQLTRDHFHTAAIAQLGILSDTQSCV
jgi:hypothetical protein